MKYKISISGTLCSGKTTLTNLLVAKMSETAFIIDEHAWHVKKLFPDIAWDEQIVRDYLLFSQLLREKTAVETPRLVGICDSGIIEAIAHSEVFGLNPHLDLINSLAHQRYDLIFVNDYKDIPLVSNGVRETDNELQKKLHVSILSVAEKLAYTPIILSGDMGKRLDLAITYLNKLQINN